MMATLIYNYYYIMSREKYTHTHKGLLSASIYQIHSQISPGSYKKTCLDCQWNCTQSHIGSKIINTRRPAPHFISSKRKVHSSVWAISSNNCHKLRTISLKKKMKKERAKTEINLSQNNIFDKTEKIEQIKCIHDLL